MLSEDCVTGERTMGMPARVSRLSVSLCLEVRASLISGCQNCACSPSMFLHSEVRCSGRGTFQAKLHVQIDQDIGRILDTPAPSIPCVFVLHYVFTVTSLISNDVQIIVSESFEVGLSCL